MPTRKYARLTASLAHEIALAENEGASADVIRATEKRVFKAQRIIDRLQGRKREGKLSSLAEAVDILGGVESLDVDQLKRLLFEMDRFVRIGVPVPKSLQPAIQALNDMRLADAAEQHAS